MTTCDCCQFEYANCDVRQLTNGDYLCNDCFKYFKDRYTLSTRSTSKNKSNKLNNNDIKYNCDLSGL